MILCKLFCAVNFQLQVAFKRVLVKINAESLNNLSLLYILKHIKNFIGCCPESH